MVVDVDGKGWKIDDLNMFVPLMRNTKKLDSHQRLFVYNPEGGNKEAGGLKRLKADEEAQQKKFAEKHAEQKKATAEKRKELQKKAAAKKMRSAMKKKSRR